VLALCPDRNFSGSYEREPLRACASTQNAVLACVSGSYETELLRARNHPTAMRARALSHILCSLSYTLSNVYERALACTQELETGSKSFSHI
jgi:hypothetical protein